MPEPISVEILQLIVKVQSEQIDKLVERMNRLEKELIELGSKVKFPLRYDLPGLASEPEF